MQHPELYSLVIARRTGPGERLGHLGADKESEVERQSAGLGGVAIEESAKTHAFDELEDEERLVQPPADVVELDDVRMPDAGAAPRRPCGSIEGLVCVVAGDRPEKLDGDQATEPGAALEDRAMDDSGRAAPQNVEQASTAPIADLQQINGRRQRSGGSHGQASFGPATSAPRTRHDVSTTKRRFDRLFGSVRIQNADPCYFPSP